MKKSLLSTILLFIAWAVSASAVNASLSAFVRLEDDDSPNSRVHRSYAQVCPERMQPNMCPTGHGFRTAGIGVLPHATHLHAISGYTSAWFRCTRLLNKSVSCGHLQIFANDTLEYSAFPGGYFTPKGTFYYITDWQGNNIAVFSGNGSLVQQTTYYPYGEPTIEPTGQRWLFGGKEREHAGGRNSYDYGPRSLGPSGNWDSADRKATENYPISPFSYCNGDPINHIDNDGNLPIPVAMFLIGAGIDFTTQISLNLVKGQSFLQALGNVDGTSVLAAGVAGAFGIPGSSTSIKIGVSIINIADAAVDVKLNGEFEYVGGGTGHEKELAKAGIDLGANMITDCWAKGLSPKATDASISTTGKAGKELSKKEQENAASIMFKTSGESLKVAIDNNKSKDKISNQEKYIAPTDAIKSINEPVHNIQINNEKLYRSIHNWP